MTPSQQAPAPELKPCPFCGGLAELIEPTPHEFLVQCAADATECFVFCTSGPYDTAEQAARVWNRRANS